MLRVGYPVTAEYEPPVLGLLPVQVPREAARKPEITRRITSFAFIKCASPLSLLSIPATSLPQSPMCGPRGSLLVLGGIFAPMKRALHGTDEGRNLLINGNVSKIDSKGYCIARLVPIYLA